MASQRERPAHLGDFTLGPRVLAIMACSIPVGAAGAGAAFCLLRLIGLITNVVFYGRLSTRLVAPGAGHHSPVLVLLAPVAGGLGVGLMARYGSEKIRGHGMPEAIEAILIRGSRIQPRVAVLKPVSAAISIGSGGPFGAEGPIIMTGGAVGSILAQMLHMTADERKTLLVAGAAAGMAATFDAPLASVLLAVELLLFEFRPRSLGPVAGAVVTSTLLRVPLLGPGPLFPMSLAHLHLTAGDQLLCIVTGAIGGLLAVAVTGLVYASEDAFSRLPLHWMWWPAIGGLIIGIGGLIEPRALGVGYGVIDQLLTGRAGLSLIVGILVVKTLIWGLSLGSGTSGGVLAPVFMIGASLGALEAYVLPSVTPGFWALVALAAVVGGVMRSPLTGIVFPLELTHAWPLLLALVVGSVSAYIVSALLLKRSVLTEKVARRGLHLSREYSVDPLEVILVGEVMQASPPTPDGDRPDPVQPSPHDRCTAHPDETLRELARRFATAKATSARVVARTDPTRVLGQITVVDLLQAHHRELVSSSERARIITVRRPLGARFARSGTQPDDPVSPMSQTTDDHGSAARARPLTQAELDQWVLFGGTWRTVTVDDQRGVVDLCTCAGEAVDRREADDPDLIARLRAGD